MLLPQQIKLNSGKTHNKSKLNSINFIFANIHGIFFGLKKIIRRLMILVNKEDLTQQNVSFYLHVKRYYYFALTLQSPKIILQSNNLKCTRKE